MSHTCSVILIVMSTTQLINDNQLLTHLAVHNHPRVCLADVKVRSQKNYILSYLFYFPADPPVTGARRRVDVTSRCLADEKVAEVAPKLFA